MPGRVERCRLVSRRVLEGCSAVTEDELVGPHLCPAPPVLRICSKEVT